jgi:hypothetical protein
MLVRRINETDQDVLKLFNGDFSKNSKGCGVKQQQPFDDIKKTD